MVRFFLLPALLVGLAILALIGYALFHHLAPKALTSRVVLFASAKSGVNGTLLTFQADGTFRYENLGFAAPEVVTGRYTRTDNLLQVDRLPKTGLLKRARLLVLPSPSLETGQGIWQLGPMGRVDSTLAVFTIFPVEPRK